MRPRRLALFSAVLITIAGLPAAAQAQPAARAAQPAAAHAQPAARAAAPPPTGAIYQQAGAVTLITGDRVTLRSDGGVAVSAAAGRKGMRFVSRTVHGDRYVYPADTLALLRDGRVDQRLFDVTALAAAGYTDTRADLPLLVAYAKKNSALKSAAVAAGVRVVRDLPVVGALALRAKSAVRASFWNGMTERTGAGLSLAAGVDHLWLDGKRKISLDVSVPQIGAPVAWQAGLDGTGVTVAILDTGVDATHPDLAGKIAGEQNFTDTPSTDDTVGHGTHVASIIAGTGAASDGRYRGVAPGAKLLIGKVCGDEYCDESSILAGMAWAAPLAPVINMSLGGGDAAGVDPLEEAVDSLTAQYDTLFVIAAGNSGGTGTVGSPSTADAALSVGAVDDQNQLADFSSRGPRAGDGAIKPEITAPGVDIVAAKARNGVIGDPAPDPDYVSLSGTSMATPHVAGSAAILAEQHPQWSSRQKKTALMGSAQPTAGVDVFGQGAGRVDVAREIAQTVEVDEGTVSFGRQEWPHDDDTPVTKPVTYRNLGTAPVTLALALSGDAPAGMFTLGTTSLTVPADGTAATTLTTDTRIGTADGFFDGYLTATATGGVRVETPYAVNKEVESYDVTFEHTSRDGTLNTDFFTDLTDLSTGADFPVFGDGSTGTVTVRLPKGSYGLFSWLSSGFDTEDTADDSTTMLVQPRLTIGGRKTVALDARLGRAISVTVPRAGAAPLLVATSASWTLDDYGVGATLLGAGFAGLYTAQIGPKASEPTFLGSANVSFARPGADGMFTDSPYTYDLAWFWPGRFFTGLHKSPRGRDLATIKASYATEATGTQGEKGNSARHADDGGYLTVFIPFRLPFQRTEYVNVDGGAQWGAQFDQFVPAVGDDFPEQVSASSEPATTLRGGHTYRQEWNRAVFAPSVAEPESPYDWVTRTGDVISVYVPLWSEGAGHAGWSTSDTTHYALYSGGKLVGEFDGEYGQVAVPAATGAYTLKATATRSAPHTLSTAVAGEWTFRSGHVDGAEPRQLALSSVRLSPKLDQHNTAPAGRRFTVPLTVEHQLGSGRATRVTAEVSYDDGQSWRSVPVSGAGDRRVATLRHPAGPGFVSLRVHASLAGGDTVSETVLRAYAIG